MPNLRQHRSARRGGPAYVSAQVTQHFRKTKRLIRKRGRAKSCHPTRFTCCLAALGMVLLTFHCRHADAVQPRARRCARKRLHPQTAATAHTLSGRLENVQAADNFRNLFETPVLFYALVACAIACVVGAALAGDRRVVLSRAAHRA